MLETIKDIIMVPINLMMSLFDFVIGWIEDVVFIVKMTASFVAKIPTLFSWLPSEAVVLIVWIFGVVVIYKVLGREG